MPNKKYYITNTCIIRSRLLNGCLVWGWMITWHVIELPCYAWVISAIVLTFDVPLNMLHCPDYQQAFTGA